MRIAKVRISGVLGIDHLEFEPGRFTEIAGPNGSGKTSVLEAIKSVVKGGEDATLIRNGVERGEVVLVIDDGTELRRRMTPSGTRTTVERDGTTVKKPAEAIKALTDMLSVNPIDFLRAPSKKRVDVLLESIPMAADAARLAEIVGHQVKVPPGQHALVVIDTVRQGVYDDRTGTNRAIKEKDATVNQLEATLPQRQVQAPASTDTLAARLAAIDAAKDAEMTRIADKLAGFRKTYDEEVEALRKQIEEKKTAFAETERLASTQRERKTAEFAAQRAAVQAEIAAIEAEQNQAARHQQTRETVATMRAEADGLRADAARQTAALDALDAYKAELLAKLPIDGLELREGELFRRGVPFDRLNSAQQVEVAIEIAKLRAGELGVICVDGLELLDSAHYEALRETSASSNLQMFVTRVSDGAFSIKADAETVAMK